MIVNNDTKFNREFPELYNWNLIDSWKLSELACNIANLIKFKFDTNDLNDVAGLRKALRLIAIQEKIDHD